jgi:pimeloyl-ACP methyl ester carboxylesterase
MSFEPNCRSFGTSNVCMALKTSLAALVLVAATNDADAQRSGINAPPAVSAEIPKPAGKMVDLGGHRLHVNCSGQGNPTVVVENGLGDFSFDWVLVQQRVSEFARICTYDRAGYAWSDPGPKPRTFAQINLELRDALAKLGEKGPYVLVGHSYGGPVVRNFAIAYPKDVAAMVQVDAAFEGMRAGIGGGKTIRLGDDAKGRSIPAPRAEMKESEKPTVPAAAAPRDPQQLDPLYTALPDADQQLQLWAQSLPEIRDAEASQTDWSGEYFAQWMKTSQTGTLGSIPLVVLTRAEGGYGHNQDVTAVQLEKERKEGQAMLVKLSTNSKQLIVKSGHNLELEAPEEVAAAIRTVVEAVRKKQKI